MLVCAPHVSRVRVGWVGVWGVGSQSGMGGWWGLGLVGSQGGVGVSWWEHRMRLVGSQNGADVGLGGLGVGGITGWGWCGFGVWDHRMGLVWVGSAHS